MSHRYSLFRQSNPFSSHQISNLYISVSLYIYIFLYPNQSHFHFFIAATPAGLYVPTVIDRHLIYVSGHPPLDVDGNRILGVCKSDEDVAQAKIAASHCALAMLATLKSRLGSLNNVKRVIKSLGMVNCVQPFGSQPDVMNGYSEVMAEVFGNENGVGVRSAVGMVLPNEISVEVEAVFELVEYKKKFGDIDNFIKGNRDLWIQYLKDDEKNVRKMVLYCFLEVLFCFFLF